MPVLPPAYVTPAPVYKRDAAPVVDLTQPSTATPSAEQVVGADGRVALERLEERLAFYSYVGGFLPSAADRSVMQLMQAEQLEAGIFPNVARWSRNVTSFSAEDVAAWQ